MADEENNTEEAPKGGKGKTIIMAVAAVALLGIGIFAGPMVQDMIGGGEEPVADEAEAEAPEVVAKGKDAIYQGIHPPLLINFTDDRGKSRFLQISLELMTRDAEVVEAIKAHTPVIRNNLILLYGDVDYDEVSTRAGKAEMLEMALTEINGILTEQTGKPGVEAVYFTNLVVQ